MKNYYILFLLFFINSIGSNAQAVDPALCYDGVDDYFNIPTFGNGVLGTNSDNNSFTIEFWVRDDNGTGKHYFSKHSHAVTRKGYFIERTATGTVLAGIANNLNAWSTVTSTITINDSSWHHIAFTYDASTAEIKLYIDAILQATSTGTFTPVFDDIVNPRVGGSEYYDSYFSGAFDEVRVWTVVRSASEIAANKGSAVTTAPSELILNYRFSDGTTAGADNSWTQIILDYSNSGSHTNIFNFTRMGACSNWSSSVDNATLSSNPATHLNFDGSDDRVDCGVNPVLDFTSGTIEAWVKPLASSENKTIAAMRTNNSVTETRWSLHLNQDSNELAVYNGSIIESINVGTIAADSWYHVAFVMTTTTTKVYFDSVFIGTINLGVNTSAPGQPFIIGAPNLTGNFSQEYFNGGIDDVRVWNVERTATQINSSKNCELIGDETGLVAYYKFNQGNSEGDNTTITALTNSVSGGNNGTLNGFSSNGTTSNWLAGSPVITGSVIPGSPTVTTPVTYTEGDMATPLVATTNGTGLLWYTLETGGTGAASAPTPTTDTVGTTSYWVASTNANGCESDRMAIVVNIEATLGVDVKDIENNLSMYPNPTNGNVTINIGASLESTTSIHDINGRLLLTAVNDGETFNLDISNYQSGLYFVKIQVNNSQIIKRLFKQ